VLLAVFGLGLGGRDGLGSVSAPGAPLISHPVAIASPIARPPGPDDEATPIGALLLIVTLGFVVLRSRPRAAVARVHSARPSDRGPPMTLPPF
jgi:hypothetical protein